MPPLRRYIRISPYSCLEVRIFLDNPSDVSTWLIRPTNPALPRIFDAVKPLILPKLKEENERTRLAKGKSGKKKKGVKDVVKGDDFEVVVFLTEGQSRHEVVVKRQEAREAARGNFGDSGRSRAQPVMIREEEDDEDESINLDAIPSAEDDQDGEVKPLQSRRGQGQRAIEQEQATNHAEDKKKLGFKTRYDGFSMWGKVLCLLVERKGGPARRNAAGKSMMGASALTGDGRVNDEGAQQALMQEWISSTQMPQDEDEA